MDSIHYILFFNFKILKIIMLLYGLQFLQQIEV